MSYSTNINDKTYYLLVFNDSFDKEHSIKIYTDKNVSDVASIMDRLITNNVFFETTLKSKKSFERVTSIVETLPVM